MTTQTTVTQRPTGKLINMASSNVQETVTPSGVPIESSGSSAQQGRSTSGVRNFFAGGFGGVCCVTVGHPFDTIKVRLQTAPIPKPGEVPLFKGTLDCLAKTVRNEGLSGLYKGMFTPVAFSTPFNAIQFWALAMAKRMQLSDPHGIPTNFQNFTSGMFAGACAAVLVCPAERIKCLLQVQQGSGGERKYKGPLNCAKQLYMEKGIRSVYRGLCATFVRDVPGMGIFFSGYEWVLNKLMLEAKGCREHLNPLRVVIAGGTTGILCWSFILPADVLKSRVQIAPEGTYPRGIRDAFRQLIKEEGVASLYKGVIPVMIRAFPANAGCFLGYEIAMTFFSWISPE
ncbi:hypothetical protein OS493_010808 [Desmophyllum pertusum]|uniref:Mitochondrial carnitine/acylcarnitine carrier protein n=1 Tax=Desmophyllum pertusum TaxID=174260 RepID=A0A9X0CZG4_9CNID|nr:hypothetical protein OS493_010808 [Desmophyllum pertusum]